MAINLRRVGEVADGTVTAAKIADGAIDLSTQKVVGQIPSSKIEDGSIIEAKLADLAVATAKLKANAVTLAKADDDIRASSFIGDEQEVSVTGLTETAVKEFSFSKNASVMMPVKIRFICTMKNSDSGSGNPVYNGTLNLYVNDEVSPRSSLVSDSLDYELKTDEFDISDLSSGRHLVSLKMLSDNALGTVYSDYLDIMLVK